MKPHKDSSVALMTCSNTSGQLVERPLRKLRPFEDKYRNRGLTVDQVKDWSVFVL